MIVTEETAAEKECCGSPAARQGRPGAIGMIVRCSGSRCMAWEWEDPEMESPGFEEFKAMAKELCETHKLIPATKQDDNVKLVAFQDLYWVPKGYTIDESYTYHGASHRYKRPLRDRRRGSCGLIHLNIQVEVNN